MAFTFGQLGSQCGGFATRFDGGCNEGHTDEVDCRSICGHPLNWCLQVHGSCDLSVVIGMGYGNMVPAPLELIACYKYCMG